jgi:sugar O-acyltransferase (sialic acid O-acetyltransferase NeuD family)
VVTPRIIIIGAGGHGAVLADALLAAGSDVRGFTDRDAMLHGTSALGIAVLGDDTSIGEPGRIGDALVNGVGAVGAPEQARRRQAVQEGLEAQGWRFVSVVHPAATVSRFADLAEGVQVLARAVVQPRARLGAGVIVNTGAIVEHDVHLGAWTHIAPGATVCGDVRLGSRCHVGAGAVVRQGIVLGDDVTIGAGAVVVHDFAGPGTLAGVPARDSGAAK